MSKERRVVVTGLGAVTPVGNTVQETWEGLIAGKNGIAPIAGFDTTNFKAKLGAEVKNFDPAVYLDVNETLRTDRYAQFAVAAAQQAMDASGICGTVEPERFAVRMGSGISACASARRRRRWPQRNRRQSGRKPMRPPRRSCTAGWRSPYRQW